YEPRDNDFPFLLELAHYEYVELALSVAEAENDMQGVDPDADLLENVPVKSELAWTLAYHFPVHRISAEFQPDTPGDLPTYLAVYRGVDDEVSFLELNPITAGLLEAIENNEQSLSGEAMLRKLADQASYSDVDAFITHGATALNEMRQLTILTGARAPA
ncbi:MAG: HvfC family RiPP maturation protein, partial [Woeseiaceae bacterium]